MISFPIIRVISKLLIPYILLFALYVQFHGDFGPGGGFQAGVIFASAIILYGLVFGLPATHKVAPPKAIEKLIALGLLLYAATGVACMLFPRKNKDGSVDKNFLDYDTLEHGFLTKVPESIDVFRRFSDHPDTPSHFLPEGQHLGIFLVELGVGITVTAVMIMIFYAFAGREQKGQRNA